jgi:hypothetical protein
MENINTFILPEIKKPEKPKKEPKKILDVKERLTRTNREVNCAYCSELKILNPDHYQLLYDIHGSDEKIADEYMCKPCDIKAKHNPVEFWLTHGELLQNLSKDIKDMFDAYNGSFKTQQDMAVLQSILTDKLKSSNITSFSILISRDNLGKGIQIKNFPFVGTINLKIYEQRKNRIEVVR